MRQREAYGIEVLPLRSGSGVGRRLAGYLEKNWIVGLIADRDLSGRGEPNASEPDQIGER